jgi:hypothetical protein
MLKPGVSSILKRSAEERVLTAVCVCTSICNSVRRWASSRCRLSFKKAVVVGDLCQHVSKRPCASRTLLPLLHAHPLDRPSWVPCRVANEDGLA